MTMVSVLQRSPRLSTANWSAITMVCALILLHTFSITAAHAVQVTSAPVLDERLEREMDSILELTDNKQRLQRLLALEQSLPATTPVATKVRNLSYIALERALLQEYSAAEQKLAEAEQLASRAPFPDSLAEVYATQMEILLSQERRVDAVSLLDDIEIALVQTSIPRIRYYANNLLANFYGQRSQFPKALQHLLAAQDAVSETDNERTLLRRLYLKKETAGVYAELKNYDAALKLVNEALTESEQTGMSEWFYGDLMLLKGYIETSQEKYEAALASYINAEQFAARNFAHGIQVVLLNNIGDIDLRRGAYDDAREVLTRAYHIAEGINDTATLRLVEFNLGLVDVHQGNHQAGLEQMEAAINYYRHNKLRLSLAEMLGEIATAYEIAGLPREQAQALQEQIQLFEEIYAAEQQQYITDMQSIYDTKDKEQQIELLQQQNELKAQLLENEKQSRLILGLLVLLAAFATVIVFMLYRAARNANRKLAKVNTRLADQSIRDPLTGLFNRRALQQQLQADRRHRKVLRDAMILLDVDHFKKINDDFGHNLGDTVLVEVARRLKQLCRETDRIIRWGGEEFLIYLTDIDHDVLPQLTQRILTEMAAEPIKAGDEFIEITVTAGFIHYPFADLNNNQMDWEQTLQLADLALYAGKVHGRNQAWGIMELNIPFDEAREVLEYDLATAIEKNIVSVLTLHGPKSQTPK